MEYGKIIETLLSRKGQFVTVVTERPLKVRKGELPIIKHSEFQARVGVNYDNISTVKEKRADGTLPAANQGLPWGKWDVVNYIIEHNDEKYVRMTTADSGFYKQATYTRLGKAISADEAKRSAMANEFKESHAEVFNIKLKNILEVR